MKYLIAIVIMLYCFCSNAQADSTIANLVSYTDFVQDNQKLYAIDKKGSLSVWNLQTQKKLFKSVDTAYAYTAIAKDKDNNIYLGAKGVVHKLDRNNFTTTVYKKLKSELAVKNIFFNSQDKMFLIVPNAVYDPAKNKAWSNFRHAGNGLKMTKKFLFFNIETKKYFMMPEYAYMDSADRIWMVRSFGEFGGTLQVFDTKNNRIVEDDFNIDFGLFFPQSVFEDSNKNIYITSGLEHMMRFGNIIKIPACKADAVNIYNSDDYEKETELLGGGIFVGPGVFNTADQKLYFATSEGFYKVTVPEDGKVKDPELLFSPELLATREDLAIGMKMPVKKMQFTSDNKLIFLTEHQGFGIYSGTEFIMLK